MIFFYIAYKRIGVNKSNNMIHYSNIARSLWNTSRHKEGWLLSPFLCRLQMIARDWRTKHTMFRVGLSDIRLVCFPKRFWLTVYLVMYGLPCFNRICIKGKPSCQNVGKIIHSLFEMMLFYTYKGLM